MIVRIITALLLVAGVTAQIQRQQRIRFFTNNNCAPPTSTTPTYRDYTTVANVSGAASTAFGSYCVVTGAWRIEYGWLQGEQDYNITYADGCERCIRGPTGGAKQFGGIRPLGGPEITKATLSLYPEQGFGGREVFINGYEYSFDTTRSFLSFAFTTYNNWSWTIYNTPHYRGNATCYRSSPGTEVTLYRIPVTVGSVRQGCRNASPPRYKELGFLFTIIFALTIPSCIVIL